jgi:hypothetical protein
MIMLPLYSIGKAKKYHLMKNQIPKITFISISELPLIDATKILDL